MRGERRTQDGLTTLLIFRPDRQSIECLEASLESLSEATELPHLIEVFVCGKPRKGVDKLLLPSLESYSISIGYTFLEAKKSDAEVMARSLAECDRRYWAYMPTEIVVPPSCFDVLFRCLRNEERRRSVKVIGASVTCVDMPEPPRCFDVAFGELTIEERSLHVREEEFAIWDVVNYVSSGPLILIKDIVAREGCSFDPGYFYGGHMLDLCMQARRSNFVFVHVQQPAVQLNPAYCLTERVAAPLCEASRSYFMEKWGGAGKTIIFRGAQR
jgi:hypothetical protein